MEKKQRDPERKKSTHRVNQLSTKRTSAGGSDSDSSVGLVTLHVLSAAARSGISTNTWIINSSFEYQVLENQEKPPQEVFVGVLEWGLLLCSWS
jgi:hypothetical protein